MVSSARRVHEALDGALFNARNVRQVVDTLERAILFTVLQNRLGSFVAYRRGRNEFLDRGCIEIEYTGR
jgi:hypothetical protein